MAVNQEVLSLLLEFKTAFKSEDDFSKYLQQTQNNLAGLENRLGETSNKFKQFFKDISGFSVIKNLDINALLPSLKNIEFFQDFNTVSTKVNEALDSLRKSFETKINISALTEADAEIKKLFKLETLKGGNTTKVKEFVDSVKAELESLASGKTITLQDFLDNLLSKSTFKGGKAFDAITGQVETFKKEFVNQFKDLDKALDESTRLSALQMIGQRIGLGADQITAGIGKARLSEEQLKTLVNDLKVIATELLVLGIEPPKDFFGKFASELKKQGNEQKALIGTLISEILADPRIEASAGGKQDKVSTLLQSMGFSVTNINAYFNELNSAVVEKINKLKDSLNFSIPEKSVLHDQLQSNVDAIRNFMTLAFEKRSFEGFSQAFDAEFKNVTQTLGAFQSTSSQTLESFHKFENGIQDLINTLKQQSPTNPIAKSLEELLTVYKTVEGQFRFGQILDTQSSSIETFQRRFKDLQDTINTKLADPVLKHQTVDNVAVDAIKQRDEATQHFASATKEAQLRVKDLENALKELATVRGLADPDNTTQIAKIDELINRYNKFKEELNYEQIKIRENQDTWNKAWEAKVHSTDAATLSVTAFTNALKNADDITGILNKSNPVKGFLQIGLESEAIAGKFSGAFANIGEVSRQTLQEVELFQKALKTLFASSGKGEEKVVLFDLNGLKAQTDGTVVATGKLQDQILKLAGSSAVAREQFDLLSFAVSFLEKIGQGGSAFGKQISSLQGLAQETRNYLSVVDLLGIKLQTYQDTLGRIAVSQSSVNSRLEVANKVPEDTRAASAEVAFLGKAYKELSNDIIKAEEQLTRLKEIEQGLSKQKVTFGIEDGGHFALLQVSIANAEKEVNKLKNTLSTLKATDQAQGGVLQSVVEGIDKGNEQIQNALGNLQTQAASKLNQVAETLRTTLGKTEIGRALSTEIQKELDSLSSALQSTNLGSALTAITSLTKKIQDAFNDPKRTSSDTKDLVDIYLKPYQELIKGLELVQRQIAGAIPRIQDTVQQNAVKAELQQVQTAILATDAILSKFGSTANTAQLASRFDEATRKVNELNAEISQLGKASFDQSKYNDFQLRLKEIKKEFVDISKENKAFGTNLKINELNNLIINTNGSLKELGKGSSLEKLTSEFDKLNSRIPYTQEGIINLDHAFHTAFAGNAKTIPVAPFENLERKIRDIIVASTDVNKNAPFLVLAEDVKATIANLEKYNAMVKAGGSRGDVGIKAFVDRSAVDATIATLNTLQTSLTNNNTALQAFLTSGNLTAEAAKGITNSFAQTAKSITDVTNEAGKLSNISSSLEKHINAISATGVAPVGLKAFKAEIDAAIKSKDELNAKFANSFTTRLETDLNRLVTLNTVMEQFKTVGDSFKGSAFFESTSYSARQALEEIQRLQSAARKARDDLAGSLKVSRGDTVDPTIAAQAELGVQRLDAYIAKLKEMGAVYSQLNSKPKIKLFDELKETLNNISEVGTAGITKYLSDFHTGIAGMEVSMAQLKAGVVPLTESFVNGFKQQSESIKATSQQYEAWLNLLNSEKKAGQTRFELADGSTVSIDQLIRRFEALMKIVADVEPRMKQAGDGLKDHLGTSAGQAELKVTSLIEKFGALQTRINSITPGNNIQEMYGSVKELMDLLNRPYKSGPFFTLPKESFAPIRNEIIGVLEVAKNLQTALEFKVQDLDKNSQLFKETQESIKAAREEVIRLSAAMLRLSEYEKNASNFSALRAGLHGASTTLQELAHEGAFIYKGLEALFKNLSKNLAPKVSIDTTSFNSQMDAMTTKLGITGHAADAFKKQVQDALNAQIGGGGLAAAEQYQKAFQQLEEAFVKFRSGLTQAAMGFQMLGDSLLEPFKKAKENFEQFSDTMGAVNAVTAATASQFEALTQQALLMGATSRFTAEQAAEALKELAKAGFDAEEQIAALPTVMRLAQAAATELSVAAQIATVVMNEFRMNPEQFNEAADVITLAANRTLASVEDLGYSFKYVGALAANIGADFGELTAAMGLLHNAGLKGCYDDQTEILTRSGFKLFKDLNSDDEVMTINEKTLEMEWQLPAGHYAFTIDEPMARIKSRYIDLLVTDNHRLLIETRAGHTKVVEAHDFKEGYFYRTGIWKGNKVENFILKGFIQNRASWNKTIEDLEIPMELWVQFLGWYLAEGCLCYNKGSYTVAIAQSKGNRIDEIRELLTKLPFNFNYDGNCFRITSQQLYQELESYGKGFNNKRVPQYVKDLDHETLKIFLEHFRRGDGDVQYNLYTSNKSLSEDLYEVALKCGYGVQSKIVGLAGDQKKFGERTITATQDAYLISISTKHTKPFFSVSEYARREQVSDAYTTGFDWVPYKGQVFSVNVPNGLVFVRRNGFGLFCGNTLAGTSLRGMLMALYNPTRDETKLIAELSERIGGLGLQIQDASGNFIGYGRILEQLEQAGITTGEVLRFFGQRAGPGMAALLAQGSAELRKLEGDLKNAGGTTAHMAEIMEQTLKGRLLLMRSAFQALSDQIGHNLAPTLAAAANAIGDFVSRFVALREEFPVLASVLDHVLAGFALFASTLGGLAVTFAFIIVPVRQFMGFLKTLIVTTLAGAASITSLSAAQAFNVKVTAATIAAAEAEFAARHAAAIATGADTTATGLNTIAKGINVTAIRAQMTALHGANAIIAANVAAQSSLWVGVKNIFLGLGSNLLKIGGMLRYALLNPYGLALTAITGIVAATFLHEKSVAQTNVELDKQNQIIEYNRKNSVRLNEELLSTAEQLKRNQQALADINSKDNPKSDLTAPENKTTVKTQLELDIDKGKKDVQNQLKQIFMQITESSAYKDLVNFKLEFDAAGNFTQFVTIIKDGNKEFELLDKNLSLNTDSLKSFTQAVDENAKAQQKNNAEQKIANELGKIVPENKFLSKENFGAIGSKFENIFRSETQYEKNIKRLKELEHQIKKYDQAIQTLNKGGSLADVGVNPSRDEVWNNRVPTPEALKKEFEQVRLELTNQSSQLKVLLNEEGNIFKDFFLKVLPEVTGKGLDELAATSTTNPDIIKNILKGIFDKNNLDLSYFDAVFAVIQAALNDRAKNLTLGQLVGANLKSPALGLVNATKDLNAYLEALNKELKTKIDEQKKIFDEAKVVVDAVKAYQSAIADAAKQKLDLQNQEIEFSTKIKLDNLGIDFERQLLELQNQDHVVEVPFKAQLISDEAAKDGFKTLSGLSGLLLDYEKKNSLALIDAQIANSQKQVDIKKDELAKKLQASEDFLVTAKNLYGTDTIDYIKAQQEQAKGIKDSLNNKLEVVKEHLKILLKAYQDNAAAIVNLEKQKAQFIAANEQTKVKFGDSQLLPTEQFNKAKSDLAELDSAINAAVESKNFDGAIVYLQERQKLVDQIASSMGMQPELPTKVADLAKNLEFNLDSIDFEKEFNKAQIKITTAATGLTDVLSSSFRFKTNPISSSLVPQLENGAVDVRKALQTVIKVYGEEVDKLKQKDQESFQGLGSGITTLQYASEGILKSFGKAFDDTLRFKQQQKELEAFGDTMEGAFNVRPVTDLVKGVDDLDARLNQIGQAQDALREVSIGKPGIPLLSNISETGEKGLVTLKNVKGELIALSLQAQTQIKPLEGLTTDIQKGQEALVGFKSLIDTQIDDLSRGDKVVELPISFKTDISAFNTAGLGKYSAEVLSFEKNLNKQVLDYQLKRIDVSLDAEQKAATTKRVETDVFIDDVKAAYNKQLGAIQNWSKQDLDSYRSNIESKKSQLASFLKEELSATQTAYGELFQLRKNLLDKNKSLDEQNIAFQANATKNYQTIDDVGKSDSQKAYETRLRSMNLQADAEAALAQGDYDRAKALLEQRQQLIDSAVSSLKPEDTIGKFFLKQDQGEAVNAYKKVMEALKAQNDVAVQEVETRLNSVNGQIVALKAKIDEANESLRDFVKNLLDLSNKKIESNVQFIAEQTQQNQSQSDKVFDPAIKDRVKIQNDLNKSIQITQAEQQTLVKTYLEQGQIVRNLLDAIKDKQLIKIGIDNASYQDLLTYAKAYEAMVEQLNREGLNIQIKKSGIADLEKTFAELIKQKNAQAELLKIEQTLADLRKNNAQIANLSGLVNTLNTTNTQATALADTLSGAGDKLEGENLTKAKDVLENLRTSGQALRADLEKVELPESTRTELESIFKLFDKDLTQLNSAASIKAAASEMQTGLTRLQAAKQEIEGGISKLSKDTVLKTGLILKTSVLELEKITSDLSLSVDIKDSSLRQIKKNVEDQLNSVQVTITKAKDAKNTDVVDELAPLEKQLLAMNKIIASNESVETKIKQLKELQAGLSQKSVTLTQEELAKQKEREQSLVAQNKAQQTLLNNIDNSAKSTEELRRSEEAIAIAAKESIDAWNKASADERISGIDLLQAKIDEIRKGGLSLIDPNNKKDAEAVSVLLAKLTNAQDQLNKAFESGNPENIIKATEQIKKLGGEFSNAKGISEAVRAEFSKLANIPTINQIIKVKSNDVPPAKENLQQLQDQAKQDVSVKMSTEEVTLAVTKLKDVENEVTKLKGLSAVEFKGYTNVDVEKSKATLEAFAQRAKALLEVPISARDEEFKAKLKALFIDYDQFRSQLQPVKIEGDASGFNNTYQKALGTIQNLRDQAKLVGATEQAQKYSRILNELLQARLDIQSNDINIRTQGYEKLKTLINGTKELNTVLTETDKNSLNVEMTTIGKDVVVSDLQSVQNELNNTATKARSMNTVLSEISGNLSNVGSATGLESPAQEFERLNAKLAETKERFKEAFAKGDLNTASIDAYKTSILNLVDQITKIKGVTPQMQQALRDAAATEINSFISPNAEKQLREVLLQLEQLKSPDVEIDIPVQTLQLREGISQIQALMLKVMELKNLDDIQLKSKIGDLDVNIARQQLQTFIEQGDALLKTAFKGNLTVDDSNQFIAKISQYTEQAKTLLKSVEQPVKLSVAVEGQEQVAAVHSQMTTLTANPFIATITAAVDQALSGISSVLSSLNSLPTSRTITINTVYRTSGSPPTQNANRGGLIRGLQYFADGGLAKFKELASQFVPGAGNTDTVPAMLTPGEFVIKKNRVKDLGVGFLNALNDGLIQFKSAGGMIYNSPINTLNSMSKFVKPNYPIPQQGQTAGGPPIDINLTIKDKTFNIKTPRDEAKKLVSALQYLERGITKK